MVTAQHVVRSTKRARAFLIIGALSVRMGVGVAWHLNDEAVSTLGGIDVDAVPMLAYVAHRGFRLRQELRMVKKPSPQASDGAPDKGIDGEREAPALSSERY